MTPASRSTRVAAERFDRQYEASDDPWGYRTSSYEREKYAETLAALAPRSFGRVLEVGCSIGVFTEMLSARCRQLVAIDFSSQAVALAHARLDGLASVELIQAGFPEAIPSGEWDLVVCSEVLYYLDSEALLHAIGWLREQLENGASVLAVSWRGKGSEEPLRGDEVHDLLSVELSRWHAFDGRRPGYRLDRFDSRQAGP